jgi:hypothetical protein
VVNQQSSREHPKDKETKIACNGTGKDGANHCRANRLHTT